MTGSSDTGALAPAQPKHHPERWRLARAGIVNVWHYYDTEFRFSGGRMILRGTNGSGKSRALEMLLPFLLDADRRKMDATGAGKVRLEDLMRHGARDQTNRLGYLWLELARGTEDDSFLTVGALVRFSTSTAEAKAWYFTTPLRVGIDLQLLDDRRLPLSREHLAQAIGADRVTDRPDTHRERIASQVFALTGATGKERYGGLLQLLHTLRAPDMGNRIDEGNLPRILSDALPPLSEATLRDAGERLDSLSDAREEQQRLLTTVEQIDGFLNVYRGYVAKVLADTAEDVRAAGRAAHDLAQAEQEAITKQTELEIKHNSARASLAETKEKAEALESEIEAIKELPAYKAGLDIKNLAASVQALRRAAEGDLRNATGRREDEERAVSAANALAEELREEAADAGRVLASTRSAMSGAGMPQAALPAVIEVGITSSPPVRDTVRCSLRDALTVERPAPQVLSVFPDALETVIGTTQETSRAAIRRAAEAQQRRGAAAKLNQRVREVAAEQRRAEELFDKTTEDADHAQACADKRDDIACELATRWRVWTSDPQTGQLLGDVNWHETAIGALLLDANTLTGEWSDHDDLSTIDAVAADSAEPALAAIHGRQADLRRAAEADAEHRSELETERDSLLAAQDPEPPTAPWAIGRPRSTSLWRAVDFAAALGERERAGLEAALLSAGLLSADVTDAAVLRAEDGQILLTPDAPVASRSLDSALRWDPAGGLDEEVVDAVLARIGLGPGHGTWVDTDGSWAAGPLRGKHQAESARYIGAAARERARGERLRTINAELAELARRAEQRATDHRMLQDAVSRLKHHIGTAPRTSDLLGTRVAARSASETAAKSLQAATEARAKVERLQRELAADRQTHEEHCVRLALPSTESALDEVVRKAGTVVDICQRLADKLRTMRRVLGKHVDALATVDAAASRRADAEQDAQNSWNVWRTEDEKFTTLTEALGAEADDVFRRLNVAEEEQRKARRKISVLSEDERDLDKAVDAASRDATEAQQQARQAAVTMRTALEVLVTRVSLPGIAEAATSGPAPDLVALCEPGGPLTPARLDEIGVAVQRALDRTGKAADQTALIRALNTVQGDVTNTFDLTPRTVEGMWLVDLTDATGRQPVALAAARLREQAVGAGAALTAREHEVFTEFVISGVGEELRRRMVQADALINAMNASLADIRTSHGIGVRLRWELAEPADSPVARIRTLVAESAVLRRPEHTAELINLLKDRVDESFGRDAEAGYEEHLRSALDYRQWHHVEVSILGPEPGQVRKISRRAKLSQGETRFVSYVALFAAADAYLSGLPDTARALRLILLDDAFAKVDDRTIGELMGLLVRMDVDFCMTGHALWGAYPQVPAVDVYEIRRAEGTAAAATHVHWDGRNRHYLRSTG